MNSKAYNKLDSAWAMLEVSNTPEEWRAAKTMMEKALDEAYEAGAKTWMEEYYKLKAKYEPVHGVIASHWNDGYFNWIELNGRKYKIIPEEET